MEDILYPDKLYHYSSMEKAYNIMKNRSIRLSDITKSNDINEMSIYFPRVFEIILELYDELGGFNFNFIYKEKKDRQALELLIQELRKKIESEFKDGSIGTFVLCLSEKGDLLSQWRGYANDGKGVSLGISVEEMLIFIGPPRMSLYNLVKVEYLSECQLDKLIREMAKDLLWVLNSILEACAQGKVAYSNQREFECSIYNTFYQNILFYIEDSIKYKTDGFSEEVEWRFYIKRALNKEEMNEKTNMEKAYVLYEKAQRDMNNFIEKSMEFNVTDDDMIPYISYGFDDFNNNLIQEVIIGPNNKIREKDLKMFLRKNGYNNCEVNWSKITYVSR